MAVPLNHTVLSKRVNSGRGTFIKVLTKAQQGCLEQFSGQVLLALVHTSLGMSALCSSGNEHEGSQRFSPVKFRASLPILSLPSPPLLSGLSLLSKHAQSNYLSADIFTGLGESTRELLMITLPVCT